MKCSNCGSTNVYLSPRFKTYRCEDCGCTVIEDASHKPKAFLSYGHDANTPLVNMIRDALAERGYDIWIDESKLKAGDNWRREIMSGILSCDETLSFLSRHSVRNPGVCLDELRIALRVRNADVKTILVEDEKDVQPPATLANRQWLDMSDWRSIYEQGGTHWRGWFEGKIDQLVACLEDPQSKSFEGEISRLEQILCPVTYGNREQSLLESEFVGKTWLLEEIQKWKAPEQERIFVIYGIPGSGKSTFASHLLHYDSCADAAVFFEYGRTELASFDTITRLIAFQLATRLCDYRTQLMELVSNSGHNEPSSHDRPLSDESLFDYLVGNPLRNCVDGNRPPTMIVLDALDELFELDRTMPARFLAKLRELPRWIKILVTTRREEPVVALLKDARHCTLNENNASSNYDIERYLLGHLSTTDASAAHILASQCGGSFLYAVLIGDLLDRGAMSVERILVMEGGLEGYYALNFQRRFPSADAYAKIRPLLEIVCGSTPMPRPLFDSVTKADAYQIAEFRRLMGPFVVVTSVRTGSSELRFFSLVHKSLHDWLTNEEASGEYFVNAGQGNRRVSDYAQRHVLPHTNRQRIMSPEDRYLRDNYAPIMVGAKRYDEYVSFLCELGNPCLPFWSHAGRMPEHVDVEPLVKLFEGCLEKVRGQAMGGRFASYAILEHYFAALESCLPHPQFERMLNGLSNEGVFGRWGQFFRSSASEVCDFDPAYSMNFSKVLVAHSLWRCHQKLCRLDRPPSSELRIQVRAMRIYSTFYNGEPDIAHVTLSAVRRFWEDISDLTPQDIREIGDPELTSLQSEYNTCCLANYLHVCAGSTDKLSEEARAHVQRAVAFGADLDRATSMDLPFLVSWTEDGVTRTTK